MEGKEKMIEIYNVMADMTLEALKFLNESKEMKKNYCVILDEDVLEMVRTTQSLYETINHANHPVIATAFGNPVSESDGKSQYGCNYTDRPDVFHEVGVNPLNC